MDIGLLLLRLAVGLTLAAQGTQKLFGWFGGPGLSATGQFFTVLGFRQVSDMPALHRCSSRISAEWDLVGYSSFACWSRGGGTAALEWRKTPAQQAVIDHVRGK